MKNLQLQNIGRIVTHSGVFHADEVTVVALVESLLVKELEIIRTRNMSEVEILDTDLVADVGGGDFDHHIEEKFYGDHKLSSIGLVFRAFSEEIAQILNVKVDELLPLEKIVYMIDNIDNGMKSDEILSFGQIIGSFNNSNIAQNDGNFRQAVDFTKVYLQKVYEEIKLQSGRNAIWENKKVIGKVVCLSGFVPDWEARAKKEGLAIEFASTYETWASQYSIQRIKNSVYNLKILDGMDGVKFCHPAGFLAKIGDETPIIEFLNK